MVTRKEGGDHHYHPKSFVASISDLQPSLKYFLELLLLRQKLILPLQSQNVKRTTGHNEAKVSSKILKTSELLL